MPVLIRWCNDGRGSEQLRVAAARHHQVAAIPLCPYNAAGKPTLGDRTHVASGRPCAVATSGSSLAYPTASPTAVHSTAVPRGRGETRTGRGGAAWAGRAHQVPEAVDHRHCGSPPGTMRDSSVPTATHVDSDGMRRPVRPVSIQPDGPGDDAVPRAGPDSAAGTQVAARGIIGAPYREAVIGGLSIRRCSALRTCTCLEGSVQRSAATPRLRASRSSAAWCRTRARMPLPPPHRTTMKSSGLPAAPGRRRCLPASAPPSPTTLHLAG